MKQQNAAHMYAVWLSMASKITKSLSRDRPTHLQRQKFICRPTASLLHSFGFHPILKGDENEKESALALGGNHERESNFGGNFRPKQLSLRGTIMGMGKRDGAGISLGWLLASVVLREGVVVQVQGVLYLLCFLVKEETYPDFQQRPFSQDLSILSSVHKFRGKHKYA